MKTKISKIFTYNLFKFIALAIFCFLLGFFEILDFTKVKSIFESSFYEPDLRIEKKDEIIFVYIGSSTCGYCNKDEHYQTIKKFKTQLENLANSDKKGFLAIGVSKDFVVQKGIEHLEKNGSFDEILVGNSWYGTGLLKYIWHKYPGEPSTPQVLILNRKYHFIENRPVGVEKEILILRLIGSNRIQNFNVSSIKKIESWTS